MHTGVYSKESRGLFKKMALSPEIRVSRCPKTCVSIGPHGHRFYILEKLLITVTHVVGVLVSSDWLGVVGRG